VTTDFINEIQSFSKLSDEEKAILPSLEPFLAETADQLTEAFYANLLKFEGTAKHFQSDSGRIERLKNHLKKWYVGLAKGNYDEKYAQDRYRIGYRHVEINLDMRYMVAAMSFCRSEVNPIIEAKMADNPQAAAKAVLALNKIMDIDLNLMLKTYVERNQELIAEMEERNLQKFLSVTDMSRELFNTLLRAAE
jgi:hypothetical protein